MRWIGWATMAMVVTLLGVPNNVAQAVTFPTLYDDFHGTQLDPALWDPDGAFGYEKSIGLDQGLGRLLMLVVGYGDVGSSGAVTFGAGRNNLRMAIASAAAVRGIQVTTRVEYATVTGCASPVPGRVLAGPYATLFRDGPKPTDPNDWRGIVEAGIQLVVFANQQDQTIARVRLFADRCLDFDCNTGFDFDLGGSAFMDVPVGQGAILGIELVPDPDPTKTTIIFTKDDEPPQVLANVAVNQTNTDLGILDFKRVRERAHLETCLTRAQGIIVASFENFMTTP